MIAQLLVYTPAVFWYKGIANARLECGGAQIPDLLLLLYLDICPHNMYFFVVFVSAYQPAASSFGDLDVWLGLSLPFMSWHSKKPMSWTNWDMNVYDEQDTRLGVVFLYDSGQWVKVGYHSGSLHPFVCEAPQQ